MRGEPVIQRVLEATIEELAEKGYRALRFEEVASRANVARTAVYRRWPTKPELVRAALESMPGAEVEHPNAGSLREDLVAVGMRAVKFSRTAHGNALMRLFAVDVEEAELHALLNTFRAHRDVVAKAILDDAVTRGEISDAADARLAAELLPAAIFHRAAVRKQRLTRRFIEQLVDFLLRACSCQGDEGEGP